MRKSDKPRTSDLKRSIRINIEGTVQGVGFRPFVYRLAKQMRLTGFVGNTSQGVVIEVTGDSSSLDEFQHSLKAGKPPISSIDKFNIINIASDHHSDFVIRKSNSTGNTKALMLPDIATCPECLSEIFDPSNRRYLYPFTNCTNCGPRYSIIEALPYDRHYTTMKIFEMCDRCREEYENPLDRRFHAQPNACPDCGPQLTLVDRDGETIANRNDALTGTVKAIREGKIVAIKGLGGFQILTDAANDNAVAALRKRKHRDEKPLAIMSPDLDNVKLYCAVSELERFLLQSYASPIVLLRKLSDIAAYISEEVAPRNSYLGVMLPYTPLHHLLMAELKSPVVATSGNYSDEPICIDNDEALESLKHIADLFLIHDRPIARHVDDSVVRIMAGREMVIRRARGIAPLPVKLNCKLPRLLAVGAHLKNTATITIEDKAFITQHIGDIDNSKAFDAFKKSILSLSKIYEFDPEIVVRDKHPDYLSSQYAESMNIKQAYVQHHVAHIYSCMADNTLKPPVLGVAWDGAGLGDDGTLWGGEFLAIDDSGYERVAHFKTFSLPGGETAIRESRRSALGVLYEIYGGKALGLNIGLLRCFKQSELDLLSILLKSKLNSPVTSSAGRLFDAVSSILDIRQINNFEGQAAMELEFTINDYKTDALYDFDITGQKPHIINWEKIVAGILNDLENNESVAKISAKYHNTLTEIIVRVAKLLKLEKVALSGGCFQNRYLTERTIDSLKRAGFVPYWHYKLPTNDGGISFGQIASLGYRKD